RVLGEVAPVRQAARRGGPRRGRDGPHHHADRAARDHRKGAGDHRRERGRRPAAAVPARASCERRGDRGRGGDPMTIYRGTVLDTPVSPFTGGALRAESDAGIAVTDGVIIDRGPFTRIRAAYPDAEVVDLTGGVVLPG